MVSLLNGLSAMGAGIASFAGTAGLEQQKADLLQKQTVLADELAHTSRTAEITQQGTIAAAAATQEQQAAMDRLAVSTASAERVAGTEAQARIGAASLEAGATRFAATTAAGASMANIQAQLDQQKPLVAKQVDEATAKVGMAQDEQALAHRSFTISTQIADEAAKPADQQDQAKISQLYSERLQLGMTPDVQTKFLMSLDGQIKATQQQLTASNSNINTLTERLATVATDDKGRPAQEAELKNVQAQRDAISMNLNLLLRSAKTYLPNQQGGAAATPGAARPTLGSILSSPGGAAPAPNPSAGPRVAPATPSPVPGLINPDAVTP